MTDANTRLAIGIVQLAAVLVIIAALKAAQDLFVPFLLAIFTATLAASPMFWIKRQGAPSWLAICLVILAIILMILFFGGIVAQSATSFMGKLPFYQSQLLVMQANLIDSLDPFISYFDLDLDLASAFGNFSPATLINLAGTTISSLGSVLSNSFLIILTVIFILAEATSFPDKLNAILTNPERGRVYFSDFTRNLNNYIAIKTTMSVITGIIVTLFLSLLGVDFHSVGSTRLPTELCSQHRVCHSGYTTCASCLRTVRWLVRHNRHFRILNHKHRNRVIYRASVPG